MKFISNDPRTPEEWQIAVDAAAGLRLLHDCKIYGLIQGGPVIDVCRCDEIIFAGQKLGIQRSRRDVDLAMEYLMRFNAELSE